jgi:hypothetical protein
MGDLDIPYEIEIEGDMSQEEVNQRLKILGELIINEVKNQIRMMDLIGKGDLLQHWISSVSEDGELTIESTEAYSTFIEFGTYEYWDSNGTDSFTEPSHPKKKDLSPAERKKFPKGGQSFAPLRKVIYNDTVMGRLIDEAFGS